jgi:hypothetical protein
VALQIDTDDVRPVEQPEAVVGVDLGVSAMATLSTGEVIEGPKAHAAALKRLRRANKAMARNDNAPPHAPPAPDRMDGVPPHPWLGYSWKSLLPGVVDYGKLNEQGVGWVMKASLVSATSVAALLISDVGLAVAGPVFDLATSSSSMGSTCDNVASPSSCTVNFYALPEQAAVGATLTMTALTTITGTLTFAAAPPGFSGDSRTANGTLNPPFSFTSNTYGFKGGASASVLGQTLTSTGMAFASVAGNVAQNSNLAFNGITVSPIANVASTSQVYARVGSGSATSTVTITNSGKGNLATGGPNATSNLNGNIGPISGTNWAGPAVTTFSVQDSTTSGPTSNTFTYTYAPQATRGSQSIGTVPVAFSNGSSDGTNSKSSATVSLTGSTVGPVYLSRWPGSTVNTPPANTNPPPASSAISWGTVGVGSNHLQVLTLANISTDANGGNNSLTDLTIESFSITGKNAANFSVAGLTPGQVLSEGQSTTVDLGFSSKITGSFSALLELVTDEGVGLGAARGDTFFYDLTALAALTAAPEPSSMLILGAGIGGVLMIRRQRRSHA